MYIHFIICKFVCIIAVPGPVRTFSAPIKGSNHFVLNWTDPQRSDMNGIIVGYDIGYQTGEAMIFDIKPVRV
jgi:hypothetical protein